MAPRLRPVPRAEAAPSVVALYDYVFGEGRDPVSEPGTPTGTPGDWWTTFANNVEVFDHCVAGFALYRRSAEYLDPRLRELGQARAGWARGSAFVYSQHCKAMRGMGFTEEQIAAIPSWPIVDCWTPLERAVLAFTDGLVLTGGRIPDDVIAVLRTELDDRQLIGLAYVTALYDLHATLTRAFRLELDDVDDHVREYGDPVDLDGNPRPRP